MQKADAVFEGGGVKGVALVGALQAFEEAGFQWQNVAGTSVGAIVAALIAVGYTAEELKEVMYGIDFRDLMDPAGIGKLPRVGPWLSLLFKQAMYQGDHFLSIMRELIAKKTGKERFTFADLILPKEPGDSEEDYVAKYKYRLRVVASDISENQMFILPQDIAHLDQNPDDLEVAMAVRMSMSYPFFFRPVILEHRHGGEKHWIIDGGMLSNFPIQLFDSPAGNPPSWPTIGFLLGERESEQHSHAPIRDLVSMLQAMLRTMLTAHDRKALREVDKRRIVHIPTGRYGTLDFNLGEEDKDWLHGAGYQEAKQFLSTWSFDDYVTQRLHPAE